MKTQRRRVDNLPLIEISKISQRYQGVGSCWLNWYKLFQIFMRHFLSDFHLYAEMSTKHGTCHSEEGQRGEELQAWRPAGAPEQTHAHVVQRGARPRASHQVHRGQWHLWKTILDLKLKFAPSCTLYSGKRLFGWCLNYNKNGYCIFKQLSC